ncbi:CDK-related protein kinase 6 putative, partial [Plasmodium cynomolgi strain B]
AFEYCDIDLLNLMKKYSMNIREAKYVIFELLLAASYLHGNNYLHRDIKPENIFINSCGEIKLGDLGLSVERTENMTPTVVTRWYRSPEILLQSKNYDHKVDVWSLGCLFVELITGSTCSYWSEPHQCVKHKYSRHFFNLFCKNKNASCVNIPRPLFPGKNDESQLDLIYVVLGDKSKLPVGDEDRHRMFPYFE